MRVTPLLRNTEKVYSENLESRVYLLLSLSSECAEIDLVMQALWVGCQIFCRMVSNIIKCCYAWILMG